MPLFLPWMIKQAVNRFPERQEFASWREIVKKKGYLALCEEADCTNETTKEHLYEFCAMNGHLRAFEEVFN